MADGAATVDVIPAWEGYYRPGSTTELAVEVRGVTGGGTLAVAANAELTRAIETSANADAPLEATLSFRPQAAAIDVSVRLDTTELATEHINLLPLERPLLAVVADAYFDPTPWLAAAHEAVALPVGVGALPRTAEGYGPVDALVLSERAMAGLDPSQAAALRVYAQACGRLLFAGPSNAAPVEALRSQAGCSARFVKLDATPTDVAAILRTRPPTLPGYADLAVLASDPPRVWYTAIALLAAYALFLAFFAGRAAGTAGSRTQRARGLRGLRGWGPVLAMPFVASLLMGLAWDGGAPERRVVVWAEQASGGAVGRFRALYEVHGQGAADLELGFPAALGLPEKLSDDAARLVAAGGTRRAEFASHVLSRHGFGFAGAFTTTPLFAVTANADKPVVSFSGAGPSPEAIMAHDGRYFVVPPLASGESWSPQDDSPTLARAAVPRALTRQRRNALLTSVDVAELGLPLPPFERASAWLVIEAADGGAP